MDFEHESDAYPGWLTLLAGRGREEYLLGLRGPFLLCLVLLVSCFAFGYAFSNRVSPDFFGELFGDLPMLEESDVLGLTVFIFVNNAFKVLLWMVLGVFFGLAPLFFVLVNGFVLGLVVHSFSDIVGPWIVWLSILPHGIVEIPCTVLGAAMGVRLGYAFIGRLRGRSGLSAGVAAALGLYARRVAPGLLLAAVLESFVTPAILRLFA